MHWHYGKLLFVLAMALTLQLLAVSDRREAPVSESVSGWASSEDAAMVPNEQRQEEKTGCSNSEDSQAHLSCASNISPELASSLPDPMTGR